MTKNGPLLASIAAIIIAGGIGYVVGLRIGVNSKTVEITTLQKQASEAKGAEDAAKQDAEDARKLAEYHNDRALAAGRDIREIRAKLARLQGEHAANGTDQPIVVDPGPAADAAIVVVQAELIAAQDRKIEALEGEVKAQGDQIKGLEKALKQADLRADIQAKASKAALDGIKQSRWLGRAEGFAAGVAIGYVGGRIR